MATGEEKEIVTIGTDLLDCSICTSPLGPPLYQCLKGHMACPSCWSKLQYKCPTCGDPIGSRNIAFESVLDSIHLPCTYANFGCRESVSYSLKLVHADTCEFGPSLCPIPGCGHKAFLGEWRAHFLEDHWGAACNDSHSQGLGCHYSYGQPTIIILNDKDRYYALLGPGKDVCLLVKEPIPNFGNVISLFYVDLADLGQNHFSYELENWPRCERYKFPAIVSINGWKRGEVHGSYSLVVSSRVPLSSYKLCVLINKERNVSS